MEKGKLEKYWRLRLPIFIAFMIAETLLSIVIHKYRTGKTETQNIISQEKKPLKPLEYLIKNP